MKDAKPKSRRLEPHWKQRWRLEPAWTARELAKLCCGWNPETGWDPHCDWEQGLPDSDEAIMVRVSYQLAFDAIRRAWRLGDLHPRWLTDPTDQEIERGDVPVFSSEEAVTWAAARFPTFAFHPRTPRTMSRPRDENVDPIVHQTKGGTDDTDTTSGTAAKSLWENEPTDTGARAQYRRAQVIEFIQRVEEERSRRIKKTNRGGRIKKADIWRVVGYKDPTQFERFQRGQGTSRCTEKFRNVLQMLPDEFLKRLETREVKDTDAGS